MNATASASLELRSALQAHGDQLDTELRLLRELPQVYLTEKCVFDRGNGRIAKKRVAICSLRCCGEQLDQKSKCNDFSGERACPTVVEFSIFWPQKNYFFEVGITSKLARQ